MVKAIARAFRWRDMLENAGGVADIDEEASEIVLLIHSVPAVRQKFHLAPCADFRDRLRRTGNLRAVQLLLGHTKIESTVRYLGIEVDDALTIAEQVDV